MTTYKNISLRNKLVLIQLATAFTAVLICGVFFVLNDIKIYKESAVQSKYSIAEIIGMNAVPALAFADPQAAHQMLLQLKNNTTILNAVVFDEEGKEFARYNKAGEKEFRFPLPHEYDKNSQTGFAPKFVVSYPIEDKDSPGTVMLRAELSGFEDIIFGYLKIAALILLIGLIAAFAMSTFLQRSITNRLLGLVLKTEEVAKTGNYSLRVSTAGNDEIGILSAAYNSMLEQIEKTKKDLDETNQQLEERVKQRTANLAAVNKELESFSYSVSHDLRAPLRAVHGYAQIIAEDYGKQLDPEANRLLKNVMTNAKKMGQLIDDLLAFSRLGRKELITQKIDMDEMVAIVEKELTYEEHVREIEFRIGKLASAQADAVTIKQVWMNVISNALKYSRKKEKTVIEIGSHQNGKEIIYHIKDNGAGFDMRYADKLFGVFQRLHSDAEFEGTGVGLAIVQRIITRHGGKVWAESTLNEGATFYFSLPK